MTLHGYQREIADAIVSETERELLLPFHLGTGRTPVMIEAMTQLCMQIGDAKVLIVTPLPKLYSWMQELNARTFLYAKDRHLDVPGNEQVTVSNIDTIVARLDDYLRPWDLLIADWPWALVGEQTKRQTTLAALKAEAGRSFILSDPYRSIGQPLTDAGKLTASLTISKLAGP